MMTRTIRAHFDGKVIVPDEPLALPEGTALTVRVDTDPPPAEQATPAQRRAAFEAFVAATRARPVPTLPDDMLRRENMYED